MAKILWDYTAKPSIKGNRNSGGIMLFIWSDIPAKVISTDKNPFEIFYVELIFRKKIAVELFLQIK